MPGGRSASSLTAWLLAVILLVAAALRLAALSALPPALYRDVAVTALDAMRAAAGHPRLHFVYDEGLYADLMGVIFRLAGASDLAVRLPGALCGVLTCLGVHRLGRALGARRAGLYGSFLMAVSLWHVILSRSGFRAVLLPLLLVYAMAFLVEGLRSGRRGRLLAAGLLIGLLAHSYSSSRVVPLLLVATVAVELGLDRSRWRGAAPGLALGLGVALAVAAPMMVHYLHHPEDFNNPQRIVSVFSPKLEPGVASATLRRNVGATLLMFHLHGDDNWRHNLAGAPMLDPITGLLFLLGLGAAFLMLGGGFARLADRPRATGAQLLAWVPILLIPNLLSVEGVPHGLRSCGVIPAVLLLAGFGAAILEEVAVRIAGGRVALAIGLLLAIAMTSWTAYRYFDLWGRDPRVFAEHDGPFRAAARALREAPDGTALFLVANGRGFDVYGHPAEVQPYLWELRDRPPAILGPKDGAQLVLEGRPGMVALVRRDPQTVALIRSLNPGAAIEEVQRPGLSPDSPVFRIH